MEGQWYKFNTWNVSSTNVKGKISIHLKTGSGGYYLVPCGVSSLLDVTPFIGFILMLTKSIQVFFFLKGTRNQYIRKKRRYNHYKSIQVCLMSKIKHAFPSLSLIRMLQKITGSFVIVGDHCVSVCSSYDSAGFEPEASGCGSIYSSDWLPNHWEALVQHYVRGDHRFEHCHDTLYHLHILDLAHFCLHPMV